jgi:hypothetical protein
MGIANGWRRIAIALTAGLTLATPAAAQFGARSGPAWGRDGHVEAGNIGYREGFERGDEERRERRPFNYADERAYRNGDEGYRREFGDRETYRRIFRIAYAEGYRDAYYGGGYGEGGAWNSSRGDRRAIPRAGRYPDNRYPGYPGNYPTYPGRSPGYPSQGRYPGYRIGIDMARSNGYDDGYAKGIEDGRDADRFDPTRHGWYKSASRGYRGQFGSKDFYRNEYRGAFRQGYERGYREAQVYRQGRGGRRW